MATLSPPAEATGDEGALARRIAAAGAALDRPAEAELCRRLGPRIRRYGLRYLRDGDAAADLAQQVLVLLLEKLRAGSVRDPDQVVSFVFGLCRQTIVDFRRTTRRREALLEEFGAEFDMTVDPVEPRFEARRLGPCLEALGERERTILVLTFAEDRDARTVASEMGLTEGNVRVIRHRALARLLACVERAP